MDITSAKADIADLRQRAGFFRKQRRSDHELYRVLAGCLALCERCDREPGLLEALKEAHLASTEGEGRTYFERGADAPLVVCRMVWGGAHNRAASWRYTAVLREAQKQQLTSATLARWMAENGGANALFLARPISRRTSTLKTLYLNQSVTFNLDEPLTLTLRWDGRGFFDVLEKT